MIRSELLVRVYNALHVRDAYEVANNYIHHLHMEDTFILSPFFMNYVRYRIRESMTNSCAGNQRSPG